MERINKTININNSRSYRNGLLPFVRNGVDGNIEYVTNFSNGNYGQYVCDFAVYNDSGETRLRYLDVIRNYNFIQEQLKDGVFVKKYAYSANIVCSEDENHSNLNNSYIFTTNFDEKDTKNKYEYIPIDKDLFVKNENYYSSSEEVNGEYFVLISNCGKIKTINEEWNKWWTTNCGEGWEECVFNGYSGNSIICSDFKFCYEIDTYALGKVEVVYPLNNGSRVPKYVYYGEVYDRKKWFKNNSGITENAYSSLNEDDVHITRLWEEMGGGDFYNFLNNISYNDKLQNVVSAETPNGNIFKYVTPTVDLSIILNSEYEPDGLYTPYEYSIINDEIVGAVSSYSASSSTTLTPAMSVSGLNIIVESQLQTLIDYSNIQVTRDISGSFKYFGEDGTEGQMFKCTYCTGWSQTPEAYFHHSAITFTKESAITYSHTATTEVCPSASGAYQVCCVEVLSGHSVSQTDSAFSGDTQHIINTSSSWTQYGWWRCEIENNDNLVCADGENVEPGSGCYRNVTIVSCIDSLVGPNKTVGDYYYVLARFDNGRINPDTICDGGEIRTLGIPYLLNKPQNIVSYSSGTIVYDVITGLNTAITDSNGEIIENIIEISYAKGVTSGNVENTGIHYTERLTYIPNNFKTVMIDGLYRAELYYDIIDNSTNKKTVYSPEYRLEREVITSTIDKMEIGTLWTESDSVSAMLFTREGTEGLQESPKEDINLIYNRGNAAAWENHFKLSECNTMEDLVNYGNNFFNL